MTTTQKSGVEISTRIKGAEEFSKLSKENEKLLKQLAKSNAALEKQGKAATAAAAANKGAGRSFGESASDFAQGANQALELVGKLNEYAMRGANIAGAEANFTGNLQKLRAATRGLISDFDLMRLSNQTMALGVAKSSDDVVELMDAAGKIAQRLGVDTTYAMESLTGALGRQSPLLLDNLGIVMKVEKAQELYAAALGKSANELTSVEKGEAFRVEALKAIKASAAQTKVATDDATLSVAQLTVQLQNAADNALLLPKHIREFGRELGLTWQSIGLIKDAGEGELEVQTELQRLYYERGGLMHQLGVDISGVLGNHIETWNMMGREDMMIDEIRLKTEQRKYEEQQITIEHVKQLQVIEQGIGPAMTTVLGKAEGIRNAWQGLGQPTSLVSLAITGAAHGAKLAKDYTAEWDWSTKKLGGSAKQVKDIFSEIGKLHQYDISLVDIQVQAANDQVAAAERMLEITQRKAEIEMLGQENARPVDLLAEQERISARKLEIAKMEVDFSRHAELEAQYRHERELARLDALAARREWDMQEQERLAQRHQENQTTITESSKSTVASLAGLATARKKDAVAAAKISQAAAAAELSIEGYQLGAQAAVAFTALQPVKGAALSIASALAFAKAAEMATRPINIGGGGSGGGGAGAGSGPSSRPGSNAPTTSGGPPSSDIPGSGGGLNRRGRDLGGGDVYNVSVLGAVDDQTVEKLMQGIERVKRTKRIAA